MVKLVRRVGVCLRRQAFLGEAEAGEPEQRIVPGDALLEQGVQRPQARGGAAVAPPRAQCPLLPWPGARKRRPADPLRGILLPSAMLAGMSRAFAAGAAARSALALTWAPDADDAIRGRQPVRPAAALPRPR